MTEEQMGQTNSALKNFQKALSLSPRDADILKNMGLIYLKTGEAYLAQDYLLRAEKLNPDDDEITLALGRTYFALAKYQKALDCYLKLKDAAFDDMDINYFIAMTYGKINKKGESHYYFGLHFKQENKKESALFHFKEALNYFPQGSETRNAINQAIKDMEGGKKKPTTEMEKPKR